MGEGETEDRGLPRRRRHPLDPGRGGGARGAGSRWAGVGPATIAADRRRRPARAAPGGDRRRQRRHPAAPAAGLARRAGRRRVDARRRRLDPPPAGRPHRRAAGADGRRPRAAGRSGCRRCGCNGAPLHGITYEMPIASAQVKSCLLFAGLLAEGETTRGRAAPEPRPQRAHARRRRRPRRAQRGRRSPSHPAERLEPGRIVVPADISSAAFFVVAALLVAGSEVRPGGGRRQPDPHRPAFRSSTGWGRRSRSRPGASAGASRPRACGSGRRRCAGPRSAAPRFRWRSTSCRSSRSPPALPRERRRSATPPSCGARSPTGSRPSARR